MNFSNVATHTPHGDGNSLTPLEYMTTVSELQLTPLTGTETYPRIIFDIWTNALQLTPLTGTETCCGNGFIVNDCKVATHTPHGDGNEAPEVYLSIRATLQLTPLTGTETRFSLQGEVCYNVATHTPHGDGNPIVVATD